MMKLWSSNRSVTYLLLIQLALVLLQQSSGSPIVPDVHQIRARRKAGDVDPSQSALVYMEELRRNMTNGEGVPMNITANPTNIWGFLDRDVAAGTYREGLESDKCFSAFHYFFVLTELAEKLSKTNNLQLEKTVLRVYLKVIPRFFTEGETIPVVASVTVQQKDGEPVFAGDHSLELTMDSDGWLELNVTEGMEIGLWPPSLASSTQIEVTVKLQVDCEVHKKVPAYLVDPAGISLSTPKRRLRHIHLQPLFIVYLNDQVLKEKIVREGSSYPDTPEADLDVTDREKRYIEDGYSESCHIENYTVVFTSIGLNYILTPYSYNARKCVGSCSYPLFKGVKSVNNYAQIMVSAKISFAKLPEEMAEQMLDHFTPPKEAPCCVPIKYAPISLITQQNDGTIHIDVYGDMKVTECGCR